jgi:fructose 1,6-bisphosphatase
MMRRQNIFGAAMLPMSELEYKSITEILSTLDSRYHIRSDSGVRAAA